MTPAEPSLREQLLAARAKVEKQIEKLQDRPYPLLMTNPFDANDMPAENNKLIEELTEVLRQLDNALEGLGPAD